MPDASREPAPPSPERHPTRRTFSGITHDDVYAWLEDPTDPAVLAHLAAENAYREAVLADTVPLQATLYAEMLGRVPEDDDSVPVTIGAWRYWTRNRAGQQYPVLLRRGLATDDPEQNLLDLNAMVRTGYIRLLAWEPSPDGRLLAYVLNETGGLEGTLRIKDLETDVDRPDAIAPVPGRDGVAWANDSQTLFYLKQDAALKAFALHRHRLGDDPAADPLLYQELDETFSLALTTAKDRAFLFLASHSMDTSEVRSLPLARPDDAWTLFAPRRDGIEYSLEHRGDDFLVLTNEQAQDFKLLAVPEANPRPANGRELVPHQPGRLLSGWSVFARAIVLFGRQDALSQIFVLDPTTGDLRSIPFDEEVYTATGDENPAFDTPVVRFRYESLVSPRSVFEFDFTTGERTLLKQDQIAGYDPTAYEAERLWATAADGTRVSISLVRPRGAVDPLPTLLFGYGSYGINLDPSFDPILQSYRPSLLNRGVAVAIAHVRGGEEMGRAWYDNGKLLHKTNTFTDFIACADFLVESGRTSRDRLAISGTSAGGLLMGAVLNRRPDLARAVLAKVPFVDVVRVMLDPSLPLTTGEFREWGDPRNPEFMAYIAAYSPIENVGAGPYPAILTTAGLNDDQVPFFQPVKWLAHLRHTATGGPFLLRANLGAGHGGAAGRYDLLREIAHDQAFILKELRVGEVSPSSRGVTIGSG